MPERTLVERLDRMEAALAKMEAVSEEIDALLDDLEARGLFPPPPAKPARPPVERRHLRLVGDERKAA